MPHTRRHRVWSEHPHHVTVRMRDGTWNLRSQRCYSAFLRSFHRIKRREDFRVTHFSVQGDHIHMLVEAETRSAMSNGLRALLISMARQLNRVMRKRGPRFADRFHESMKATASAVRTCLRYVLNNHAKHMAQVGKSAPPIDPFSSAMWFDGYRLVLPQPRGDPPVSAARSWLLTDGRRELGLL